MCSHSQLTKKGSEQFKTQLLVADIFLPTIQYILQKNACKSVKSFFTNSTIDIFIPHGEEE